MGVDYVYWKILFIVINVLHFEILEAVPPAQTRYIVRHIFSGGFRGGAHAACPPPQ